MLKRSILKKFLCLALAVFMLTAATACGGPAKGSSATSSSGSNKLTISVIAKDNYLDTAIQKFQEQHPGVTVDVKEYTSEPMKKGSGNEMMRLGNKPEDIEKYANAMNTQLMSGKATDIMQLNNLPYEKYIDKGLLANMSEMMRADKSFDTDKYYTNILDAMKYNGSLYGFPMGVELKVLEANKALLDKYNIKIDDSKWSWSDFEQVAETIVESARKDGAQDMYAAVGMSGSELVSGIVAESFNKYVDKSKKAVNFDSPEFIGILNLVKSMIDNNYINTDKSEDKIDDLVSRGSVVFSTNAVNMYVDLMFVKQVGAEYMKFPGDGDDLSFTANSIYGINDKSPNKELAWEFIKFLASDEMMSDMPPLGLPVNKAAAAQAAQNAIELSKRNGSDGGHGFKIKLKINGQIITPGKPLTQEDTDMLQSLLNKASKYSSVDEKVTSIITEETQAFFESQKTADETAKVIQDRVSTYINE